MMALSQHNLGTVVGFEFMRTIKKKGFVVATLAIPVVLVVVFALIFASNSSTEASADAQKNSELSFTYTDASGIIPPQMAQAAGGTSTADPDTALAAVKDGTSEAYFVYPKDPAAEPVKVRGRYGRVRERQV
jgi:ABC-2 type transport system permease protein